MTAYDRTQLVFHVNTTLTTKSSTSHHAFRTKKEAVAFAETEFHRTPFCYSVWVFQYYNRSDGQGDRFRTVARYESALARANRAAVERAVRSLSNINRR